MGSLRTRGYSFDTLQDKECARLLKEEYCQIKLIEHKMKMVNNNQLEDTQYTSSDQKIYKLGQEKYTSAEGLFGTNDFNRKPLQNMLIDSINKCDIGIQSDIAQQLVLSGGTTMLQGFTRRIREELSDSVKNIYIIEVPNRKFLSFIGATKLEDAKDLWISKDEFHESGVQIIHQKCF